MLPDSAAPSQWLQCFPVSQHYEVDCCPIHLRSRGEAVCIGVQSR